MRGSVFFRFLQRKINNGFFSLENRLFIVQECGPMIVSSSTIGFGAYCYFKSRECRRIDRIYNTSLGITTGAIVGGATVITILFPPFCLIPVGYSLYSKYR